MTSEQVSPARQAPRVAVAPADSQPDRERGRWRVSWRIQNLGEQPLQLVAARLPHDRFWSPEQQLPDLPMLLPGQEVRLELFAAVPDRRDEVVENAFLVLRVLSGGEPWRLLARHRVLVDPSGTPRPECEAITVQRVGFAG